MHVMMRCSIACTWTKPELNKKTLNTISIFQGLATNCDVTQVCPSVWLNNDQTLRTGLSTQKIYPGCIPPVQRPALTVVLYQKLERVVTTATSGRVTNELSRKCQDTTICRFQNVKNGVEKLLLPFVLQSMFCGCVVYITNKKECKVFRLVSCMAYIRTEKSLQYDRI